MKKHDVPLLRTSITYLKSFTKINQYNIACIHATNRFYFLSLVLVLIINCIVTTWYVYIRTYSKLLRWPQNQWEVPC